MTVEIIRDALAWCAVIKIGFLLWWMVFFMLAHDVLYRYHRTWFHVSSHTFDALRYAGMALFKGGLFLCNLVPYLALRMVSPDGINERVETALVVLASPSWNPTGIKDG